MNKRAMLLLSMALTLLLGACVNTTQTTTGTDDYDYSVLSFPQYLAENPVRYFHIDDHGMQSDGWQNFGPEGEIQTHPWPWTTYIYQMYSYFIRNDLQALYAGATLPSTLAEMPVWIAQTSEDGHRILWYSMTSRTLPSSIVLLDVETVASGDAAKTFLRAEYEIVVMEATQRWIVYFMDTDGIYSSYSIRVNESYENVRGITDATVSSYRLQTQEPA